MSFQKSRLYGALTLLRVPLLIVAWALAALAGAYWALRGNYAQLLIFSGTIWATALVFPLLTVRTGPNARGGRNRSFETLADLLIPMSIYAVLANAVRAGLGPVTVVAGVGLLALVWTTVYLSRHAWKTAIRTAHLPGAPERALAAPPASHILRAFAALFCASLGVLFLSLVPLPGVVVMVGTAILTFGALALAAPVLRVARHVRRTEHAVVKYGAKFVIFHDGLSQLHWDMWVPYLLKSEVPILQVATREKNFDLRAETSDVPLVLLPDINDRRMLRTVFPSATRAIFYPRNAKLNSKIIEMFPQKRHVFLHHGDGDKPASSNKTADRYDILVVAGEAAIDRYAMRGVKISREKFRILGRPVAADFLEASQTPSQKLSPHVLYAPTWKGLKEEVNFSSLEFGPEIIKRVLERGATVIFRPHPSGQHHPPHKRAISEIKELLERDAAETGRAHIWGEAAERRRTLADVANLSDLMIADVSGVITDYMQTLKPLLMVATKHDAQAFVENFPSARSAYVVESSDLRTLDSALDLALGADPLRPVRERRRNYYLGGYAKDEAVSAFIDFLLELAGETPESQN